MKARRWLSSLCCSTLLLSAVISPAFAVVPTHPPAPAKKATQRLSPNVVPSAYDLNINPNLQNFTFNGSEKISLNVDSFYKSQDILLNSKELNVAGASLTDDKGARIPLTVRLMPAEEMVGLHSPKPLAPGSYTLALNFNGKLNEKLVGLYHSTFKDAAGKQHHLAVTQFEPTDARRMFPCFDEPTFKARFKLTVRTRKEFNAVSNAAVAMETTTADGAKKVEFAQTPPMSTYLLALAVGELEPTAPVNVHGVNIRVWSVKGKSGLGAYSRDEAAKLLPALTDYFDIAYPWGKLDLLAIPDFEAGAMENPGCITFRETLLLIDPKTASNSSLRSATSVIAHEMAHLWFGDLVTMKWWDDLWLNEAFATWMATKATDTVHPDWQEWKGYVGAHTASLQTDSLTSTRAIHADVKDPEQAREMFDEITYEKGASILRMLERYVSDKAFQSGVHNYLVKHSWHNATTNDLWEEVDSAWRASGGSGDSIRQTMDTWVMQPGYPLLKIADSDGKLTITQSRFFQVKPATPSSQLWNVPVFFRPLTGAAASNGQSEAQKKILMASASMQTGFNELGMMPPYEANAGATGYYRVKYPDANFNALKDRAEKELDAAERVQLVDDSWALAKTGDDPIEHFLDLSLVFKQDKDDELWGTLGHDIAYLDSYVDAKARPSYERYVRDELQPLMSALGWQAKPDESQQTRLLRGQVIGMLGTIGQDQQVIAHARDLFSEYVAGKGDIDRDVLGPLTSIVAYNGGEAQYEQIKKLYQSAKTPEIEHRNLFALASFATPALIEKTLNLCTSGSVRIQDAPHLLGALLSSRRSNERAFEYTQQNWGRITSLYSQEMVPRLISRASSFNTEAKLAELKKFCATHPMPMGETTIKRTIERTGVNVQFRSKVAPQLDAWLLKHYPAT